VDKVRRLTKGWAGASLIVVALVIAGCGGGSETTASSGTAASVKSTVKAPPPSASRQSDAKTGSASKEHAVEAPANDAAEPSTPAAPTAKRPLPNEGSKAAAPGVPTVKGGDNSVQTFGVESPSADRVEAAAVLQSFLDARAQGQWPQACSYLSSALREQLEALGKQTKQASLGDCPAMLGALSTRVAPTALHDAAEIQVISMRVEGSHAFLIYKDSEDTPLSMPVSREGDAWKVAALDGSALAT
jgi:hypothetical protein